MNLPCSGRVAPASRHAGLSGVATLWRWLWMALLLGMLGLSGAQAQTSRDGQGFDHLRTGFPLTGAHASQRCESCHAGGQFKGTPRTCNTCHLPGSRFSRNNVVMPASHYPTSQSCDTCHGTTQFAGARFNHAGVTRGACQTCHTGGMAVSKPAGHMATQASCDSCHRTAAWTPASNFSHDGVVAGSCATCHNGRNAVGKSAIHVPVPASQACDDCHRNFVSFRPAVFVHNASLSSGQCASCHSGGFPPADGKSANHVPYQSVAVSASANCDACHKGSFSSWANGRYHAHFSVAADCATCHTGAFQNAVGKPSDTTHATVTGNCESCHKSTASWSGAKVDHSGFNAATNCGSCHAVDKKPNHLPTSANCFTCHNVSPATWKPAKWNHTQVPVAAQCASCHTGGYPPADGRSTNHIPYASIAAAAAANCDTCHKAGFAAWTPASFHASVGVTTQCATCHTGGYAKAVGKPADTTHAAVTGNCESCHKSTATWAGAKTDHSGFTAATNCSSCHAANKTATHMPTSANCFTCHNVSPATWKPAKWNHTQVPVASQCASCHTGGYPPADGKGSNHVPYQSVAVSAAANCDACHKGSFTTWANGRYHANFTVTTGCATCHTGAFQAAVGKPADTTHATVTGNCESCHKSTATWAGAKTDHSGFTAATNCSSCHAADKTATHMPTSANCFTCHNVSPALWKPAKWNHTQVTVAAQCASCHTGGYPPADGKSANHVPYQSVAVSAAANCDACHKGSFTTWANGRYHANFTVTTNCATCHTGGFQGARGKPADTTHAAVTGNCESCHKSTAVWTGAKVDHSTYTSATNCSSCHAADKTATHMPTSANCFICHNVSPARWTPTKWNHTQVTVASQCASCHTGGYPPADGKSANHVPYQSVAVAAAANCDACHKGSFTTWANGRFHANFSVSTGCVTCHTGAFQNAVGKPANAIHATVTGNCEGCHKTTASWAASGSDHSSFTSATNCASCHGVSARGKSATHIPTALNCFLCHAVAPAGWTPTKWNHTQSTVANQCATCHSGGYPPADGKPANHMPYANVAAAASANCDACHKGSFTTWANGRFHANYTVSTGCKTCHTGAYLGARGLSSNHIPLAQLLNGAAMECNACHTSTTSWLTQTMNHNNSQGNGSGWCIGCHLRGTAYAGGMQRMSLTHERSTGVTDCSQSGCHRPLGNKGTAYRNWD